MTYVDIVIARYNEDISWVKDVEEKLVNTDKCIVRVFLYNKGTSDVPTNFKCISLLNVGRESHTYLHHILEHYDEYSTNVNDIRVVFLQGAFLDHARLFYKGYDDYYDLISAFIKDVDKHNGASLSWAKKHEYVGLNRAHWNFHINTHNGKRLEPLSNIPFGMWFVTNVHNEFDYRGLDWWVGALFCASSKLFTSSRSKEYFTKLFNQLHHLDPEVGHFFERSWVYILGAHKLYI